MEKNFTYEKRKYYNDKDSSLVYLIAIFLPFLLSLLFTLIVNVISGATGIDGKVITSNIWYIASLSIIMGIAYVVLYLVYNKANNISYNAIKIDFKMKWHTYLIIIAIGIISLFGLQYFISIIDKFLTTVGYPLQNSTSIDPKDAGTFILAIFVMAVIPSITEELLFRGIILQGLRKRFGDIGAIYMTALLFALMHMSFQQLIYPFILGSIMGYIVIRTGSLISSIVVHFINNFLVIMFAFIENTTGFSLEIGGWVIYLIGCILLFVTIGIIYIIDRFYFKHKNMKEEEIQEKKIFAPKLLYISIGVALFLYALVEITNIVTNT